MHRQDPTGRRKNLQHLTFEGANFCKRKKLRDWLSSHSNNILRGKSNLPKVHWRSRQRPALVTKGPSVRKKSISWEIFVVFQHFVLVLLSKHKHGTEIFNCRLEKQLPVSQEKITKSAGFFPLIYYQNIEIAFCMRKWPMSLGFSLFLFFFCHLPSFIILLQWLIFYWACFQFKTFLEVIIETGNLYHGVAMCSCGKFCSDFFT